MDDTLEDVARIIGCTPANVADRVEEILKENRDLLMDRHGLRAEGLKLAEEIERVRLSCREAEWAARRCECGADDACAFARERDEARAEIHALKECLSWYVAHDDSNEGGWWDEDNATWLEGKRRAMRLLGLLEAT